jgi:hypothetical protein
LPLSEKARIAVYLPALPNPAYRDLLDTLDREFTYAFGGCTILRALAGSYLSQHGLIVKDQINLIWTDTPLLFGEDFDRNSRYSDRLREVAFLALEEEAVLVVAFPVYHSE